MNNNGFRNGALLGSILGASLGMFLVPEWGLCKEEGL